MNCEQCSDLISARLDGELTQQEEADLSAHLRECPACRAIAEDLQNLHSALVNVGQVKAPEELTQNVMAQITNEKQRARRRLVRQLTGLAACLVLCVGLYRLNRTQHPATADPNLPSVARHADPQPFDLREPESYSVSHQQRLRLSDTATSFEPFACLLDSTDSLAHFLTRLPKDDLGAALESYNEEFFLSHRLLAIVVQEPSSSIGHTITAASESNVTILRRIPDAGDCDMALWLLLAQTELPGPNRPLDVLFTQP